MEHNCERHTFEVAEGVCRSCQGSFCPDCLLYPFGKDEEPYCKPCAIAAGGIRSTAGNRRRVTADAAPSKKRGGLLARLRRGGEAAEEEAPELTPDELLELEAQEARKLLDAQRLPTEEEVEEEPEPIPTPNIAPPGSVHEERELNHRDVPESVSGGLDLGNGDLPDVDVSEAEESDDPDPEPDRESIDAVASTSPDPVAVAEPEPTPTDMRLPTEPAVPDLPPPSTAPVPALAGDRPSEPIVSEPEEVDPDVPDWALPPPEAEPAAPEPVPAVADVSAGLGHEAVPAAPPIEATTADGVALFAPPTAAGDPAPPEPPPEPVRRATDPEPVPTPVGSPAGEGPRIGQQARDETAELLRRIADLRGR